MKKIYMTSALLMLLGMFALAPSYVGAEPEAIQTPKLIVVKYDADW